MKKLIGIILMSTVLVACGPSKEEIEYRQKQIEDSIAALPPEVNDSVVIASEPVTPSKYFSALDFNLIPGKIVGWAPTDEEIETWRMSGGSEPDGTIYIQIQDASGLVIVKECDHRAWVNLHTGDILK